MNNLKKLLWIALWSFVGGSVGMDIMVASITGLNAKPDTLVRDLLLGPVLMVSFGFLGWLGGVVGVWLWLLNSEKSEK